VSRRGPPEKTVGNRRCYHRVQVLEDIADTAEACGIFLGIIAYYLKKAYCRVLQTDTIDFYRRAAALVFPSVWNEPSGLPTFEAQACGTPVFSTYSGGIPEYVSHGRNGTLVVRGEAKEPVMAISQVLEIPCSPAMGEAGRQRACGTWYRHALPIWPRACPQRPSRMVSERPLLKSRRPASGSFSTERRTGSPLHGLPRQ